MTGVRGPARHAQVRSMTGFCSVEGSVGGHAYRLEMKALNHRFLDLKLRLPRELGTHELAVRQALQSRFSRGALEVKLERRAEATAETPAIQVNLPLARAYHEALSRVAAELRLPDGPRLRDIVAQPEVLSRGSAEAPAEELWPELERLIDAGVAKLTEMRETEGAHLAETLLAAMRENESAIARVSRRREECRSQYDARVRERVKAVFDAYPMAQESTQSVLETRVAQELAMLLDRTDVQEELTRFTGHVEHFRKTLAGGGPVGRKLDFILQELNREINTLGNKAQDLSIGEEVVALKVRLEQIREQVMNLE